MVVSCYYPINSRSWKAAGKLQPKTKKLAVVLLLKKSNQIFNLETTAKSLDRTEKYYLWKIQEKQKNRKFTTWFKTALQIFLGNTKKQYQD